MKILIDIHQGIGDVIHCIPLIENIRYSYPDAYIIAILSSKAHCALLAEGLIDETVVWKELDSSQIASIRKKKIDLAFLNVVTNMYKGVFFLKHVLGAKTVVSEYAFQMRTKSFVFVKRNTHLHRVIRNLKLAEACGLQKKADKPDLIPRLAEIKRNGLISKAEHVPGTNGIVGICMGSGATGTKRGLKKVNRNVKQWPISNVVDLCKRLVSDNYIVYILGGPTEKNIGEASSTIESPLIIDYTGKCTLEETMDIVSQCNLCVGVDTGIMHMAAALSVPTVALFGPTSPKEFAPFSDKNISISAGLQCQYCYDTKRLAYCEDNVCMSSICAEEVYEKCIERLKKM